MRSRRYTTSSCWERLDARPVLCGCRWGRWCSHRWAPTPMTPCTAAPRCCLCWPAAVALMSCLFTEKPKQNTTSTLLWHQYGNGWLEWHDTPTRLTDQMLGRAVHRRQSRCLERSHPSRHQHWHRTHLAPQCRRRSGSRRLDLQAVGAGHRKNPYRSAPETAL